MKLRVFLTVTDARQYIERNRAAVKQLYRTQGLTARVTAERLGVSHSQAWAKALHSEFPKGAGHGGARLGSGNKPGITFCTECHKATENCICSPSNDKQ